MRPILHYWADPASIQKAVDEATADVEGILSAGAELRQFRGKPLLRILFNRLFPDGTISYSEFVHRVAAQVAKVTKTKKMLNGLFDELERSATDWR